MPTLREDHLVGKLMVEFRCPNGVLGRTEGGPVSISCNPIINGECVVVRDVRITLHVQCSCGTLHHVEATTERDQEPTLPRTRASSPS